MNTTKATLHRFEITEQSAENNMGMFDTIRCHYPLPGLSDPSAMEFQTKDFGSLLNDYTITAAGRLIEHYVEYEMCPEEERPAYSTPQWETPFGRFAKSMRVKAGCERDVDTEHHGWINFYGGYDTGELRLISPGTEEDERHSESREWFSYQAKFTDGQLMEVKRIEPTRIARTSRVVEEGEDQEGKA